MSPPNVHQCSDVAQVGQDERLLHLIGIPGLTQNIVRRIFARADDYQQGNRPRMLAGKLVVLIFWESSTRTRTAFEVSAKQLGADVVSLDQTQIAYETKKESLADTIRTVAAMGAAGVVIRHGDDDSAREAAHAATPPMAIINGGNGCFSHPTQALTDCYTLRARFGEENLADLSLAIVGDVAHSRVARSNAQLLRLLGARRLRLVGSPRFCPPQLAQEFGGDGFEVTVEHDMDKGLDGMDVVMMLRLQHERHSQAADSTALTDYCLSEERLARLGPNVVVMHPGPINRGVEITDAVADGGNSLVLEQVKNGMAIRFAVLSDILG